MIQLSIEVMGLRMLYFDFAYSVQMQIILAIVTFVETFLTMLMISNVIMAVFKVNISVKQRLLFIFINGTLLQSAFVYIIYFLGGMLSFSPFIYLLVVNVNPLAALIYYYSALRIFRLSNERSVKLMSYMFLFWATKVTLGRLIAIICYIDPDPRYNYLVDAVQQAAGLFMFFALYKTVLYILGKTQASLKFSDNMFFNKRKELIVYFFVASMIFAINVIIPSIVAEQIAANVIVILLTLLYTVISICIDVVIYNKQVDSNRDAHIGVLFRGMEELRGVKHDFNNILQTYSGYLELKEYEKLEIYHDSLISATSHAGNIAELTRKMHENPTLISLLISKIESAEKLSVKLLLSVKCSLDDLYIDNMDIAKIMMNLLDNAIEAASCSKQRKAYLTVEKQNNDEKIFIVTNSTPAVFAKDTAAAPGSDDVRILKAREILHKYGNCSLQIEYRDQEMSAYVKLRNIK